MPRTSGRTYQYQSNGSSGYRIVARNNDNEVVAEGRWVRYVNVATLEDQGRTYVAFSPYFEGSVPKTEAVYELTEP